MELPFRVELPKLSHLHILELVSPFLPGLVIAAGLMLSTSPVAHRLGSVGLGYKTKVAIGVAATYIAGLAAMVVFQSLNYLILTLIFGVVKSHPWNNTYWRRVAKQYVGAPLSPETTFTPQELDGARHMFQDWRNLRPPSRGYLTEECC